MPEVSATNLTTEQIEAEELLIKAAQKNPRDFAPLYEKYFERIVSYIYHRIENKDEAFEITAQVFYKALSNLSKYKSRGLPFSAWLFRIASNEMNHRFRKNISQRTLNIDDLGLIELK